MDGLGKLIVFEGIDGCGKTTQIAKTETYLKDKGFDVVRIREPGGTEVGEKIRDILLNVDMDPMTELMLFNASRMEIVTKIIVPALKAGKIVLADRFIDSTFAYQGFGRGLYHNCLYLERLITEHVSPDHVFYLNVSVETSEKRLNDRRDQARDRLDAESLDFKRRLKQGFTERLSQYPTRMIEVDAEKNEAGVFAQIRYWLECNFVISNLHLADRRRA